MRLPPYFDAFSQLIFYSESMMVVGIMLGMSPRGGPAHPRPVKVMEGDVWVAKWPLM